MEKEILSDKKNERKRETNRLREAEGEMSMTRNEIERATAIGKKEIGKDMKK